MRKWLLIVLLIGNTSPIIAQWQYQWNARTQSIYESITHLKIPEARKWMAIDSKTNANNLSYVLLESYADFYQLFLNENTNEYNQLFPKFKQRINLLELGPKNNPQYLYSLGLAHLHKSLVAIRFDKNFEAALDFRKAYLLFKENKQKFPHYSPNDLYLGILTTVIGTIPKGYQWMASVLGMTGRISDGNALVLQYLTSNDALSTRVRNEALFIYPYLLMNFEGNEKKAFDFIDHNGYDFKTNQMHAYMVTNLYLNHQKSAKALSIVNQMNQSDAYLTLPFWQLEIGYANLNELKLDKAQIAFLEFIYSFKGNFYIKDAYERLSWIALLQGNTRKANQYRAMVLKAGNEITDADKQAAQNARSGKWPHPLLLKARLLSDGGYQNQALALLVGKNSNDFSTDSEKTEFAYRLARIYDLMGQEDLAIKFYTSTIEKGMLLTDYFAARAALQIGLIYEHKGNYSSAISYFNTCINMKNHAFKNSLDQKAKSGIQRCLKQ